MVLFSQFRQGGLCSLQIWKKILETKSQPTLQSLEAEDILDCWVSQFISFKWDETSITFWDTHSFLMPSASFVVSLWGIHLTTLSYSSITPYWSPILISRGQHSLPARTDSLLSGVSRYLFSKEHELPEKMGCFCLFWSRFLRKNSLFFCDMGCYLTFR